MDVVILVLRKSDLKTVLSFECSNTLNLSLFLRKSAAFRLLVYKLVNKKFACFTADLKKKHFFLSLLCNTLLFYCTKNDAFLLLLRFLRRS